MQESPGELDAALCAGMRLWAAAAFGAAVVASVVASVDLGWPLLSQGLGLPCGICTSRACWYRPHRGAFLEPLAKHS